VSLFKLLVHLDTLVILATNLPFLFRSKNRRFFILKNEAKMKFYQLPGLVSGEDSGEQRFIQVSSRIPPQVR
jgi:hypothetical protein